MEMLLADLVDRYTILLIKQQKGLRVEEPIDEYKRACLDAPCQELMEINSLMWEIEERISRATDIEAIGIMYLALRGLTKRRVDAKNRIAARCHEPLEVKSY